MKWLFLIALLLASVTAEVVESGRPTMPEAQPRIEAPTVDRAWMGGTVEAVMAALRNALRDNNVENELFARDWLAMHRKKDGDAWNAAEAHARQGKIVHSMYWLQQAARGDGCDVAEVEEDGNFSRVVKDAVWPALRKDLLDCASAWEKSAYRRIILTLPKQHRKGDECAVVVGMHGYGSKPEDFAGDDFQKISDELNVVFVAVSGRGVMGGNSFEWTGDVAADQAHVFSCLEAVKPFVREKVGSTVVMGFSQGGQMALELLVMNASRLRGAVAMSPGSRHASKLHSALPAATSEVLLDKKVFLSWISGEGEGLANRCRRDAAWFGNHGAKTILQEFPGEGHSWPLGYAEYFSLALQVMR